ncbi:flagellar export chaperone FliS [Paenibacillus sp. p3-SID1389]|uniref:flagellar export chaperone FliS n=1 Tax=Paenibacillus TaxID=44249 RepID=UPI0021A95C13|nr:MULTISPECIES: flagellar export chaperone FliS [Paenibacillus]MCT2195921.1 flagellar export chaperone FliS [Paenibacillus sp. p3-SID1389]MEC2346331.1 flagellar export chaperone FliS [Paenibacillus barengoltzii]
MVSPNLAGYQAYQKNKYETASPHRLTLMLYNGAIQFAGKAKEAIDKRDIEETNSNLKKTQDIIYELISSLNIKEGGELALNLKKLYFYMIDRLIEANIKKLTAPVDEVIGMLQELRSAWEEIGKRGTLGS